LSPNLGLLKGKHVPKDLSEMASIPVLMDNDVNCMALGEGIVGVAKGKKHYIAVTLGTGVGGAIVSDGSFISGYQGGGGEIGHVQIHHTGPICGCGSNGCLEAYIGTQAVLDHIIRDYPRLTDYNLNEINKLAMAGDAEAVEVFTYIAQKLAVALASLVNIFNPQLIVIGGGISKAGDLLIEPLLAEIKKRAFKPYTRSLKIVTAKLGDWAGVVGAGVLAVDK
jgi:glucokinase